MPSLMAMYRRWQLRAMHRNQQTLTYLVSALRDADPAVFQKRDGGDGWTIPEVLGHLGDFESYFGARMRCIAGDGEEPPQPTAGPVVTVRERGYAQQDAFDLLARWQRKRAANYAFLESLDVEDDALWEGSLPFGDGPFSLDNQLILTPMHDSDHMNQIVKIIEG